MNRTCFKYSNKQPYCNRHPDKTLKSWNPNLRVSFEALLQPHSPTLKLGLPRPLPVSRLINPSLHSPKWTAVLRTSEFKICTRRRGSYNPTRKWLPLVTRIESFLQGPSPTPQNFKVLQVRGKLQNVWERWEGFGLDPWSIKVVKMGYSVTFLHKPPLHPFSMVRFDQSNQKGIWIQSKYHSLYKKRLMAFSPDLKEVYFQIPIHPVSREFLRMEFLGMIIQLTFTVRGQCSAPLFVGPTWVSH